MSNPYKIIEPTCISFSGGRTSAYMLYQVIQAGGGNFQTRQLSVFKTQARKMKPHCGLSMNAKQSGTSRFTGLSTEIMTKATPW